MWYSIPQNNDYLCIHEIPKRELGILRIVIIHRNPDFWLFAKARAHKYIYVYIYICICIHIYNLSKIIKSSELIKNKIANRIHQLSRFLHKTSPTKPWQTQMLWMHSSRLLPWNQTSCSNNIITFYFLAAERMSKILTTPFIT